VSSSSLATRFVGLLDTAIGAQPSGTVLLHAPTFEGNEWKYLKECIDTGWVSSVGKYVDTFEARLAEYTGAQFAVVVSNGTSALQVALWLAGVTSDTEVIVPALSFVATANAVVQMR
jgi:perosamine synthetase